ncbi:transposon Tn10 TetC protein [bacterium BMS3Bbin10]|nr:transposon Tn10 TetC protein [bacterium BMS3Bbin10]
MPYTSRHKEETRRRIVASARRLFNKRGFSEVSIDEIMGGIGLTRGGFYNHFATKDELFAEALRDMLDNPPKQTFDGVEIDFRAPPDVLARRIIGSYLSRSHFDDVEGGCPMIALPSDVARGGEPVKRAYRQVLDAIIGVFQASQENRSADARASAVTMATLCIGGMVLARAVDDDRFAAEIRDVAMNRALEAGGWDAGAPSVAAE